MHQGRPYGLHVIGKALTADDAAFIDVSAKRLSNLKQVSQLENLKLVYDLPDGGSFIVQDMGGNFRVIAFKPIYRKPLEIFNGVATTTIPMFFSGVVTGMGMLQQNQGLPMLLSRQTARRLAGYDSNITVKRDVELLRFACEYGPTFSEFLPPKKIPGIIYTQYIQQRPTWYSGAMAGVMQIVGGYGKQLLEALPLDDAIEQSRFNIPSQYHDRIKKEMGLAYLPAYSGSPDIDGQFQYDYKYLRTDAISFDSSNKPWLVRIDSTGVWAMPLPLIPATTTDVFHEYMRQVDDTEILAMLDRFGGMPSGETFPMGAGFQAWLRAGVIIKVCSSSDFHQHMPYSTAMGWSANEDGTEFVNTCCDYDESDGLFYSLAYKLRLRLGAAIDMGWIKTRRSDDLGESPILKDYLSKLFGLMTDNKAENIAIKYKLNRVNLIELSGRAIYAAGKVDAAELDYWNNLTLEPIAQHQGNMVQIGKGYIKTWHTIKVPDPVFKGCISIPVAPINNDSVRLNKLDTIILAYYIGSSLKTVRNFNEARSTAAETQGNFEDYMYVGKWEQTVYAGDSTIQGDLYLSDVDDRREVAPTETNTKIFGTDLGFSGALYDQGFRLFMAGITWRVRFYTHKTTTVTVTNKSLRQAVLMPYFCRDALIYTTTDTQGTRSDSEVYELKQVRDPNSYDSWTDGAGGYFDNAPVKTGRPYPVNRDPIWAETHVNNDTNGNSWFADEGEWLPGLPYNVKPLLLQYGKGDELDRPRDPYIGAYSTSQQSQPATKYKLMVSVTKDMKLLHNREPDDRYYKISPDPIFRSVFYQDACKVTFGKSQYANISENDDRGGRKRWGDTVLANHQTPHHFFGVINE